MPRRCIPLRNDEGVVIGSATVYEKPYHCATCRSSARLRCDYPVQRINGKPGTCDRWICNRCATTVGPDRHLCPPHARLPVSQPQQPGLPLPSVMPQGIDMTGQTCGSVIVERYLPNDGTFSGAQWLCRCTKCGGTRVLRGTDLRRNPPQRCLGRCKRDDAPAR